MFTDLSGTQIFDNYTFLDGFPQFFLPRVERSALQPSPGASSGSAIRKSLPLRRRLQRHRHERRALRQADVRRLLGLGELGRGRFLGAGRPLCGRGRRLQGRRRRRLHGDERREHVGAARRCEKNSEFFQAGGYVQHSRRVSSCTAPTAMRTTTTPLLLRTPRAQGQRPLVRQGRHPPQSDCRSAPPSFTATMPAIHRPARAGGHQRAPHRACSSASAAASRRRSTRRR